MTSSVHNAPRIDIVESLADFGIELCSGCPFIVEHYVSALGLGDHDALLSCRSKDKCFGR